MEIRDWKRKMTKAIIMTLLSTAMLLAMVDTGFAKSGKSGKSGKKSKHKGGAGESKLVTYVGSAEQVATNKITVLVPGDHPMRHSLQLTAKTTYTGGELVKGAQVTIKAKGGKALSVDVAVPTQ